MTTTEPGAALSREEIERLGARLDGEIGAQAARIRRRFLVHGLGWLVAAICAVGVVYYTLDRALGLPALVRLTITVAFAVYLLRGLERRLLYPMRRALARDDVALTVEHRFPELGQRLISAVQLRDELRAAASDPSRLRNQSPEMIGRTVAAAADAIRGLPLQSILDPQRTRRVWSIAGAFLLTTIVGAALQPVAVGIFLQRVFGLSVPYPRQTQLIVELPPSGPDFRVDRDGRSATVTLAAGADLPVIVQAVGLVPRDVFLAVEGGRGLPPQVAMTARGADRFRHVFRRVQGEFAFHTFGGDDDEGDLEVTVKVAFPPLVGTIRATLTPPAYTGATETTQTGGSVEALVGTRVRLQVQATGNVASAELTFLESGERVALTREQVQDDAGPREHFAGSFTVDRSDRYQVELVGADGLRNPHPGQYPVLALPDHAPVGRLFVPIDDSLNVLLPTGWLPLRVEARDDYRLDRVVASVRMGKAPTVAEFELLPRDTGTAASAPVVQTILSALRDVPSLFGTEQSVAVGDSLTVTVTLTDNRDPAPQVVELPPRTVHIVGESDLSRRIAGHFRRVREEVERALALQVERRDQTKDLVAEMERGTSQAELRTEVTRVEAGQGSIRGAAERIHQELMRAFDVHLWNRLEPAPAAASVVETWQSFHAANREPTPMPPDFYTTVAEARRAGRIGSLEKVLDPILDMVTTADRMARVEAPKAIAILGQAGVAATGGDRIGYLRDLVVEQDAVVESLTRLRGKLDEWNEFQDVVSQTRAILDKQREVQSRTKLQTGDRK